MRGMGWLSLAALALAGCVTVSAHKTPGVSLSRYRTFAFFTPLRNERYPAIDQTTMNRRSRSTPTAIRRFQLQRRRGRHRAWFKELRPTLVIPCVLRRARPVRPCGFRMLIVTSLKAMIALTRDPIRRAARMDSNICFRPAAASVRILIPEPLP